MKRIVNMNPESAKHYLKPDTRNMLLIIMAIKLVLSFIFTFIFKIEGYSGLSVGLFYLIMFALMYDVCSFYQVCLQIAQSIFIGFLLFLLLLLGAIFIFTYAFSFLAVINPSSAMGQNISLIFMALICLIPLVIDVVRLIQFLKQPPKETL